MKKKWKTVTVSIVQIDKTHYGIIDNFLIHINGDSFTNTCQLVSKRWNLIPSKQAETKATKILKDANAIITYTVIEEYRICKEVGLIATGNIAKLFVNGKRANIDTPMPVSIFFQYHARKYAKHIAKRKQ